MYVPTMYLLSVYLLQASLMLSPTDILKQSRLDDASFSAVPSLVVHAIINRNIWYDRERVYPSVFNLQRYRKQWQVSVYIADLQCSSQ